MMKFKFYIVYLFLIFVTVNAEIFIREYNYDASELEGMTTARENALKQIKTILLEEIGILIKVNLYSMETEVNGEANEEVRKSIVLISEGIMQTEILQENWDGKKFYIKVKVEVDIDDIEKRLVKLDSQKTDPMIESQEINLIVDEYKANKEKEIKKKELIEDLIKICTKYKKERCIYLIGNIPKKKLNNAKKSFYIPHEEEVILLFDDTFFGSAKDGLAICGNGIYWHNYMLILVSSKDYMLTWSTFSKIDIRYNYRTIFLGEGNELDTDNCRSSTSKLAKLLKEVQKLIILEHNYLIEDNN